jgi:hypothetical protein
MNHTFLSIIISAAFIISGCATHKPYAQNPFNPYAKIPNLPVQNSNKPSDSSAPKAANLALTVASRPIPGAFPHGADIGIAAAALLLHSGKSKPLHSPDNSNYFRIGMPGSEASDDLEAQIKMGALVEKAIIASLHPIYETRIEEYDDQYLFNNLRVRWIRVNGPQCENWSCQVHGPIPTKTALQWEGKITKNKTNDKDFYIYRVLSEETIGFVKITNEYDENKLLSGRQHIVEGKELPDLDYEQFFQRVSANLPDWVYFYITQKDKWPYTLNKGIKTINAHI